MNTCAFKRLTIIGTGLIGGSLAMAAREMYEDLWIQAVDVNGEALQYLLKARTVDEVSLTIPSAFEEDHLIILACHLSQSLEALKELAPKVKGKAITVSDVGSCKRAIGALGKEVLPGQFIGAHPLSGKEFSGTAHAASLLFANKSYILCPTLTPSDTVEKDNPTLSILIDFFKGLGASPRILDAETHDLYMAYMSHLPQLYAILLTNLLSNHQPGHLLSYHGGGIDDQLRLSASPYAMWKDVFAQNKDNMDRVTSELAELLTQAPQVLNNPDLAQWFNRSNQLHQQFQALKKPAEPVFNSSL
ncbi:MAG: prephenate dehydrogenase [Vampirovibrio sp.]|nr:prephenate dehydrogenase [Vampirovibrio sp.]